MPRKYFIYYIFNDDTDMWFGGATSRKECRRFVKSFKGSKVEITRIVREVQGTPAFQQTFKDTVYLNGKWIRR